MFEGLKNDVAKALGLTGQIQWILRMGYVPSYPEPVSLRKARILVYQVIATHIITLGCMGRPARPSAASS